MAAVTSNAIMGTAKFIDVDGINTRYYEAGQGEPLLLFHGCHFGKDDNIDCAENWALNWEGFAKSFRVFAVDKVGQGWSDNPKRDEDYRVETVVQHGLGFARALGLDRFHLVGHSRGGYLVTRMTREAQDKVITLTVVDSGTVSPGGNPQRDGLVANAPKPLLSRESIKWVTMALSHENDSWIDEDWMDVREAIAKEPKNAAAVEKMNVQNEKLFLPSLAAQKAETLEWIKAGNLKVPTLLVWGKNDPSATLAGGLELFDVMSSSAPQAQMHIFNRAGHYSYREHPDAFVDVVTAFIQRNRGK
jgi:pimeloyl-ACP methyl ester carboxylesterase